MENKLPLFPYHTPPQFLWVQITNAWPNAVLCRGMWRRRFRSSPCWCSGTVPQPPAALAMVTILLWGGPGWGQPWAAQGQQSPAAPSPLCARLSCANIIESCQICPGVFPLRYRSCSASRLQNRRVPLIFSLQRKSCLGNRGAPMGLCLRRKGINQPAHRDTNTFVICHILTSKQNAPVLAGLLILFGAQTTTDTSPDSANLHCIRGHGWEDLQLSECSVAWPQPCYSPGEEWKEEGRWPQLSSSPSILLLPSFPDFRSFLARLVLSLPCSHLQRISTGWWQRLRCPSPIL